MASEDTKIRRGLFGMRTADVERLLGDREQAARVAAAQIQATEEQRERLASWTGDASASLGGLRDRLVDTHDAIQHMRAAVEQAGNSTRAALSDLERQVAEVTSLLDRFRDVGPAQPAQEAES